MSASATYPISLPTEPALVDLNPVLSTALVVGSLSTAQNGQYQFIISNITDAFNVERQLVDRLLDGGMRFLPYTCPLYFTSLSPFPQPPL